MQTEQTMEARHFINFLAIRAYYRLFATLVDKKLIARLSPADVLMLLHCKKKVKINNEWMDAEVPKKAKDVLDKIFSQMPKQTISVTNILRSQAFKIMPAKINICFSFASFR